MGQKDRNWKPSSKTPKNRYRRRKYKSPRLLVIEYAIITGHQASWFLPMKNIGNVLSATMKSTQNLKGNIL
jgi:hypothetical protein